MKAVLRVMLQRKYTTRICFRWNRSFVGQRVLVASVFLFLFAASRLVGSQNNSSTAPATPHPASPAAPAKAGTLPLDGLKLSDDQKTKIAQIRQNGELRREAIIKNDGLTQDRKETMLLRLHRMETSEIFRVLTPDQQKEVQKRIADQRTAERKDHQSKQAAPASPATN
jgi:Spy/CpxP family protein refolding chaperone